MLAFRLAQAGDVEGTLEQSQVNLEACEPHRAKKPKLVARAHYNLGMSYLLVHRFDEAERELEAALRLQPNKVISQAIAETRRSRQINQEYQQAAAVGLLTPGAEEADSVVVQAPLPENAGNAEERLTELAHLYSEGLITRDLYTKKVTAIISQSGAPGKTTEEQLRSLKALLEAELITQDLYERKATEILGKI